MSDPHVPWHSLSSIDLYRRRSTGEDAHHEVKRMVTIRLLGKPAVDHEGQSDRSPRGKKAWALLAYLVLSERPPTRRQVAEMLFGNADDPLRALRWTLAELRRCVGDALTLDGDPLQYTAARATLIDVALLADDDTDPATLLDMDGVLLDGVDLSGHEAFDSWLIVARHPWPPGTPPTRSFTPGGWLRPTRSRRAITSCSSVPSRCPVTPSRRSVR
jgi:hypothetical protein